MKNSFMSLCYNSKVCFLAANTVVHGICLYRCIYPLVILFSEFWMQGSLIHPLVYAVVVLFEC